MRDKYFSDFDVQDQHNPAKGNAMCIFLKEGEVRIYSVVCFPENEDVAFQAPTGMTDVKNLPGIGVSAYLGTSSGARKALVFHDDDTNCTATLAGAPDAVADLGKALAKALTPEAIGRPKK